MTALDDSADRAVAEMTALHLHRGALEIDAGGEASINGEPLDPDEAKAVRASMVKLAVELFGRAGARCCAKCACTDYQACAAGCTWAGPALCTSCEARVVRCTSEKCAFPRNDGSGCPDCGVALLEVPADG